MGKELKHVQIKKNKDQASLAKLQLS